MPSEYFRFVFTNQEKARAEKEAYTVNDFYGAVIQSQIQSGSGQSAGMAVTLPLDTSKVEEFINNLAVSADKLGLADDEHAELQAEVKTIKAQLESPRPKDSIINEGLSSVRRILEGATAGLAAQLLTHMARLFM